MTEVPTPSSWQNLLAHGWDRAKEHPLGHLQGRPLGEATLVVLLGPQSRYGAQYFQIFGQSREGLVSQQAVLVGLHHSGPYPAQNWIEIIAFFPKVDFLKPGPSQDIAINDLAQALFSYLAELIPPGGHLMVEYDSPPQEETARGLAQRIPAAATPLGYLLFSVGCGAGFKDWYFPEGGREGPRKLQGTKALDADHARGKAQEMARELNAFLLRTEASPSSPLTERARDRAQRVLAKLTQSYPDLADSTSS